MFYTIGERNVDNAELLLKHVPIGKLWFMLYIPLMVYKRHVCVRINSSQLVENFVVCLRNLSVSFTPIRTRRLETSILWHYGAFLRGDSRTTRRIKQCTRLAERTPNHASRSILLSLNTAPRPIHIERVLSRLVTTYRRLIPQYGLYVILAH